MKQSTCRNRSAGAWSSSSWVICPDAWLSTFTGSAAVLDKWRWYIWQANRRRAATSLVSLYLSQAAQKYIFSWLNSFLRNTLNTAHLNFSIVQYRPEICNDALRSINVRGKKNACHLQQTFASLSNPPAASQIRLPTCALLYSHCSCRRTLYCHTTINK